MLTFRLKVISVTLCLCAGSAAIAFETLANPALLPKHPGHPMSPGLDPVTSQALTNDSGQRTNNKDMALEEAARYHDKESVQNLKPDATIESQGAGRLPKIHGYPDYRIEPPVTQAIDPSKFSSAEHERP
jgi:hypothetical protein